MTYTREFIPLSIAWKLIVASLSQMVSNMDSPPPPPSFPQGISLAPGQFDLEALWEKSDLPQPVRKEKEFSWLKEQGLDWDYDSPFLADFSFQFLLV